MKKMLLALCALAAALSLAACGGAPASGQAPASPPASGPASGSASEPASEPASGSASEEAADYTAYTLQFDVPPDFAQMEEPPEGVSAMFQTADGSSINLVIYDNDGSLASDVTQDAIVSLLEGSLEQMSVEAQVLDPVFETGKLGGVCPYYRIDYTVVMGDVVMGQTMLGINADRAYTFTYTDMTGDWGQIFADAVASITPVAQ